MYNYTIISYHLVLVHITFIIFCALILFPIDVNFLCECGDQDVYFHVTLNLKGSLFFQIFIIIIWDGDSHNIIIYVTMGMGCPFPRHFGDLARGSLNLQRGPYFYHKYGDGGPHIYVTLGTGVPIFM